MHNLLEVKRTWPGGEWSWDSRFAAVASSFGTAIEAKARESAGFALPLIFTSQTIAAAPPALQALATKSGGLRAGQLLLASHPDAGVTAFGLWWPWGSGTTVTLRIGLDGGPGDALKTLFGVK